MNTITPLVNNVISNAPLVIGKQGENNVTVLRFTFPRSGSQIDPRELTFRIVFQFVDTSVSPAVPATYISPSLVAQGEDPLYIEYVVEANALGIAGDGQMEVYGYDTSTNIVWKSNTFTVYVAAELEVTEEAIPQLPEWVIQLEAIQVTVVEATSAMDALRALIQGKLDRGELKGDAGAGIAAGGAPGQVLVKKTAADYDTEWQDPGTTDIPADSIGNDKLRRSTPNEIVIVHNDIAAEAVGDSNLRRNGTDKIVITNDDIEDEHLNALGNGTINTDEVSGLGEGLSWDASGIEKKDALGNIRTRSGDLDRDETVYGYRVQSADGNSKMEMLPEGIYKNGQLVYVDFTTFNNTVLEINSGNNHVFFSTTAPDPEETTVADNDVWYDTDDGNKLYRWSDSAWVAVVLDASKILAAGSITAAEIAAGVVTALLVEANLVQAEAAVIQQLVATALAATTFTLGTAGHERFVLYASNGLPYLDGYDAANVLRMRITPAGITRWATDGKKHIFSTTTEDYGGFVANATNHDVQDYVNGLPKVINHAVPITVNVEQGAVVLENFSGTGMISIVGNAIGSPTASDVLASLTIKNCNVRIEVQGMLINGAIENYDCSDVTYSTIETVGANSYGVYAKNSNITINGAVVSNKTLAAICAVGAHVNVSQLSGVNNPVAFEASLLSAIIDGTLNTISATSRYSINGGLIFANGQLVPSATAQYVKSVSAPTDGKFQKGTAAGNIADSDDGICSALTLGMRGSTVAGTGWTISNQGNRSTVVGDLVFVQSKVSVTAKSGDATGNVQITGLPVSGRQFDHIPIQCESVTFDAGYDHLIGYFTADGTTITLYQANKSAAAIAALPLANISNSSKFYLKGFYAKA